MSESVVSPARVLIVAETPDLRDLLETVVDDAGYAVLSARSLHDALTLLATRPVDLLLVHLSAPSAADPFAAVRTLRDRVAPCPVGLVSAWPVAAEAAERHGFAFLVPMPFDLDRLLLAIAASIAHPLSPDQERQAHVVRRYFAALEARAWDALLALCTDDICYVLPTPAPFATTLQGQAAFRAYTVDTFAHFPATRFTDVEPYATPHGIAARYTGSWQGPDGGVLRQEGVTLFAFAGDLIAQIGVHLKAEELRALLRPTDTARTTRDGDTPPPSRATEPRP